MGVDISGVEPKYIRNSIPFKQRLKDALIRFSDYWLPVGGDIDAGGGYWMGMPKECGQAVNRLNKVLDQLLNNEAFKQVYEDMNFREHIDFPDILYHAPELADILTHPELMRHLKSYLGKRYKIDYVCLSLAKFSHKTSSVSETKSGEPHHDSVGHRLKLFMPLTDVGLQDNPTNYSKGTHKTRWKTFLNDRKTQERDAQVGEVLRASSSIAISPKGPCCVLFDTNGLHWGEYKRVGDIRIMIQVEFTAGLKRTWLPGKLGQAHIEMHPKAYQKLKQYVSGSVEEVLGKVVVVGRNDRQAFRHRLSDYM